MLTALESVLIVLACVTAALLLIWQLRRIWPPESRKEHNDLIGWQIGFLATSYAVIVAFMLSGVWSGYQEADNNAEVEANSLILLYRSADGLSPVPGSQLKALSQRYAEAMIAEEWPAMLQGRTVNSGMRLLQSMWKLVVKIQPQTPGEQIILTQTIAELSNLSEHYRIRQHQRHSQLPKAFWLVLIAGGVITVSYTCLLGVESRRIQVLQVGTTTLLVSLILVTIADVDQPFGGAIRVSSAPFHAALRIFQEAP